MSNLLAHSPQDLDQINGLLSKDIPSYRQAYSDRTAWLMACLSELAYIKFNPIFATDERKKLFLDVVSKLDKGDKKSILIKLIDTFGYDHQQEKVELEKNLGILKMQLVSTFDESGTQAILVSNEKFVVLAFRGTEKDSMQDIKADLKAKTIQSETGGKIHQGFKEAFERVALDVQMEIKKDEHKDKPLFITGHSLGGALATVAAKNLSHSGGIAACYTFGSPRVGDDEWIAGMKAPVYRVVNAADCVTIIPFGKSVIVALCWLTKHIPGVGDTVRSWLAKFGGYIHCGDMRYLTNCQKNKYGDVKLLYYASPLRRFKGLLNGAVPWKRFLSDHSISVYRKKLMIVAQKRNPTSQNSSSFDACS